MKIVFAFLLAACFASAQTPVTLAFSGSGALISDTNFSLSGTVNITGLPPAVVSGGGGINNIVMSGQNTGSIPGTLTFIFPTGEVMYGTFFIPSGIVLGTGPTSATGSITIAGGTGKYDGVRAYFPNVSGSGQATSFTTATLSINGPGTLYVGVRTLAQLAFGGGWYTAIYCSNYGNSAVNIPLTFIADNGTALNIPGLGTTTTMSVPAGGTTRVEALNQGALQQGYVLLTLPENANCYGIFRQSVAGVPDQEAVVPLSSAASTYGSLTYDDTLFITGVSISNPSTVANIVTVTAKNAAGTVIGTGTISLPAKSKTAVSLRGVTGLSAVAGTRGTATFTVNLGFVSFLGLRFNGTAFTSIPGIEH